MSKKIIHFKVSLPSEEGYIGQLCKNRDCGRYFKVRSDDLREEMFCPYCATQFSKDELLTKEQEGYVKAVGEEKVREYMHNEIDKRMRQIAQKHSRNRLLKLHYKSRPYRAKTISPRYKELSVDSELICPECNFAFQVFGIFGYCPGCGTENLLIYDANLAIIKQEISANRDPQRALRHAYSDLVSTFEIFCKTKAQKITTEITRFQILFETRKFFKKHLGIDILSGLSDDELLVLRRVFQKRHAYEHDRGIITEKYIRMIPEDSHLLGNRAELTLEELTSAAEMLRRVLDNLVRAT